MSRETHLFIDTRTDSRSLEGAIGTIIGTSFTESDASNVLPPPAAQAKLPGLFLELGRHDFENDRKMAFADYPFDLAIVPVGSDTRLSRHDVGPRSTSPTRSPIPE